MDEYLDNPADTRNVSPTDDMHMENATIGDIIMDSDKDDYGTDDDTATSYDSVIDDQSNDGDDIEYDDDNDDDDGDVDDDNDEEEDYESDSYYYSTDDNDDDGEEAPPIDKAFLGFVWAPVQNHHVTTAAAGKEGQETVTAPTSRPRIPAPRDIMVCAHWSDLFNAICTSDNLYDAYYNDAWDGTLVRDRMVPYVFMVRVGTEFREGASLVHVADNIYMFDGLDQSDTASNSTFDILLHPTPYPLEAIWHAMDTARYISRIGAVRPRDLVTVSSRDAKNVTPEDLNITARGSTGDSDDDSSSSSSSTVSSEAKQDMRPIVRSAVSAVDMRIQGDNNGIDITGSTSPEEVANMIGVLASYTDADDDSVMDGIRANVLRSAISGHDVGHCCIHIIETGEWNGPTEIDIVPMGLMYGPLTKAHAIRLYGTDNTFRTIAGCLVVLRDHILSVDTGTDGRMRKPVTIMSIDHMGDRLHTSPHIETVLCIKHLTNAQSVICTDRVVKTLAPYLAPSYTKSTMAEAMVPPTISSKEDGDQPSPHTSDAEDSGGQQQGHIGSNRQTVVIGKMRLNSLTLARVENILREWHRTRVNVLPEDNDESNIVAYNISVHHSEYQQRLIERRINSALRRGRRRRRPSRRRGATARRGRRGATTGGRRSSMRRTGGTQRRRSTSSRRPATAARRGRAPMRGGGAQRRRAPMRQAPAARRGRAPMRSGARRPLPPTPSRPGSTNTNTISVGPGSRTTIRSTSRAGPAALQRRPLTTRAATPRAPVAAQRGRTRLPPSGPRQTQMGMGAQAARRRPARLRQSNMMSQRRGLGTWRRQRAMSRGMGGMGAMGGMGGMGAMGDMAMYGEGFMPEMSGGPYGGGDVMGDMLMDHHYGYGGGIGGFAGSPMLNNALYARHLMHQQQHLPAPYPPMAPPYGPYGDSMAMMHGGANMHMPHGPSPYHQHMPGMAMPPAHHYQGQMPPPMPHYHLQEQHGQQYYMPPPSTYHHH